MRLFLITLLSLQLLLAGTSLVRAESPQGAWHSDLDSAWKQSQESQQPMLLFLTMDGCAYRTKMTQHTFSDEGVKADLATSYVAASVDGVKHPQVAQKLRVRAYPATFLVGPDTRVLDRIDGYVTAVELRQRLAKATEVLANASNRQAQLPSN